MGAVTDMEKRVLTNSSSVCWFVVCAVACRVATAQGVEKPGITAIPEVFVVSSVAYRDFEKRLLASRRGESAEQQYASDIRNYEIKLSSNGETYTVTFTLKPFHGTEFFGGVERYVLDQKTHAILEQSGEK